MKELNIIHNLISELESATEKLKLKKEQNLKKLYSQLDLLKDEAEKEKMQKKIQKILNKSDVREQTSRSKSMLVEILENEFISNKHWVYNVQFAFRDALDIAYGQMVKDEFRGTPIPDSAQRKDETKTEYLARKKRGFRRPDFHYENVWTQGILINFKEYDTIHKKDKSGCVEVKKSYPMKLGENGKINYGAVIFHEYEINEKGQYKRINIENKNRCNQLEFLEFLITGVNKYTEWEDEKSTVVMF